MVHTLRRATADDAAAIAGIQVRALQKAYRGLDPDEVLDSLSVDERASTWADLIAGDEAALTIVAENTEGGEVSGFCTLFAPSRDDDAPANVCELAAIYVEPERWRWGIGRALMRAVLDKATGDGFEAVTLWVYGDYAPARRFYESFGFKPDGASRQKPERLDEVRLRLTLA